MTVPATTDRAAPAGPAVVLTDGRAPEASVRPVAAGRVYLQVGLAAVVAIALVIVAGVVVVRRLAEREAVNDASRSTDLLARVAVQPALLDSLATPTPAAADLRRLDAVVRSQVLDESVVRVKLWRPDGRIVYSDEPRLIGQTFPLGAEERAAIAGPRTDAEITDLSRPENAFERGRGRLLEVYRPVWTPDGHPLLFETYTPYQAVRDRSVQLWRGFAGIVVSSLLVLILLLLPIFWTLLDRGRRAHRQRERLLTRAVDASAEERRRIAGTLHDGVVQELVATSLSLSAAAAEARRTGPDALAGRLSHSADMVRASIGGLRSLLVDIYPPSLQGAGLAAALDDLARSAEARGIITVVTWRPAGAQVPPDVEPLLYRAAQELVRNAVAHSEAAQLELVVEVSGDATTLTVTDDGRGFDVTAARAEQGPGQAREGHLGLQVLTDLAAAEGARLTVRSAPGRGTTWQLTKPTG